MDSPLNGFAVELNANAASDCFLLALAARETVRFAQCMGLRSVELEAQALARLMRGVHHVLCRFAHARCHAEQQVFSLDSSAHPHSTKDHH